MTRRLRMTLLALAAVLAVTVATLLVLLQDANRFKPGLQAVIENRTGVPVHIDGDLRWRLWPALSLRADAVRAQHQGQHWDIGRLALQLDLLDLISAPDRWEIRSLTVFDAVVRQRDNLLVVSEARVTDLAPNRPAALSATLEYTGAGQTGIPVRLDGHIRADPASNDLTLIDTRFETDMAHGICNARGAPNPDAGALMTPAPAGEEQHRALLPVAALRAFDWSGDCLLDWLLVDERRFEQIEVHFTNHAGISGIELQAPRFFGGQAVAEVVIDATHEPVSWTIEPTLTAVDSTELLDWLDQRLQWAAPLAYGGTLNLEGNTREALLASLSGQTRFDGGQGHINIAKIRTQLVTLAAMFNEGERIERWPEVWQYQRLVGDWRIDRQQHHLDLALDNLIVTGSGDYRPETAEIDMHLELTFQNDPTWPVFQVHPMLYDLPIPIRCRGALADPTCRLDSGAAQRIVAQALAGGEDNALRASLEEKIDTQVPAQYRDAARSLLDLLGGSRQERSQGDRNPRDR